MNESAIIQSITEIFSGVDVVRPETSGGPEIAWGDTFFIHDPKSNLEPAQRFPFATIVTKDYEGFDCASNLNRPGVFRLNIGITRETFRSLFGENNNTDAPDFAALDKVMPHPAYGKMFWICVLNPSEATFKTLHPLLTEAYNLSVSRFAKRGA